MVKFGLRQKPSLVRKQLSQADARGKRHDAQCEELLVARPVEGIARIIRGLWDEDHAVRGSLVEVALRQPLGVLVLLLDIERHLCKGAKGRRCESFLC
jgi:hypothetical protein